MICKTVQTLEEFQALEPAWRCLHDKSPEGSFFTGFDFAWVWWQSYGSLGQLCIYVVETQAGDPHHDPNNPVMAIAPLYRTRCRLTRFFRLNTLRFIGRGGDVTPDDLNVLLTPIDALAEAAVNTLAADWQADANITRLLFEDLPEQSRFYSRFRAIRRPLCEHRESRLVAELPETWDAFTSTLSRNTRKRAKNRANRLANAETMTLAVCTEPREMQRALAALVHLHRDRQTSKGEFPAFSSPAYLQFHEALIEQTQGKETVKFVILNDGADIVGVEYLFCHQGTLSFYQTGFDPAYEPFSPGHNMMVHAIKHGIENGFTSIDLLKGNYHYKYSYAKDRKHSVTISCYATLGWRWTASIMQRAKTLRN